jgi:dipeptidyl aminopeptidase/acylaminoacyl peptidase
VTVGQFAPEMLLGERLILGVDGNQSSRVWAVRRPREDGSGYIVELWRSNSAPERVDLPFSLAAIPALTPAGAIAIVGNADDAPPALWLLEDGQANPRRLTEDGMHVVDVAASPRDGRLMFRAKAGEPRFLVGKDVARRIADVDYLADGTGFRDQRVHAFIAADGQINQLTDGRFDVLAADWSASGDEVWLLAGVVREKPYEQHELWTVRAEPGSVPNVEVSAPGWVYDTALSPDGVHLAWLGRNELHEETRLWLLERATGRRRRIDGGLCVDQATFPDLLPLQAPRSQIAWSDDGTHVQAIATVRGNPTAYSFPIDGGDPQPLVPNLSVGFLRVVGHTTLLVASDGTRPAEVLEVTSSSPVARLSDERSWIPTSLWPRITELTVDTRCAAVHGWVMEPPEGAPADGPTVLHVHGGPYSAHGRIPWIEMVALASRGYRVLVPNPRGSVSYGDAWSTAINGRWGTVDADDLHAFVDAALERGLGTPGRLGVLGLSYGGFMTAHLLATSDRFRAGIAENPVTNFISAFGMSDLGALAPRLFSGSDEIEFDRWLHASPLYRAANITTPLLLLQGERDDRCPLPESMQLYTTLKTLGRTVELVRLPEESHMMFANARPDRRVYRLGAILDWFDRHLAA